MIQVERSTFSHLTMFIQQSHLSNRIDRLLNIYQNHVLDNAQVSNQIELIV